MEDSFRRLRLTSTSKKWKMFFFRPVETFNTVWPVNLSLFHYRIRLRSRKVVGSLHRPPADPRLVQDMRLRDEQLAGGGGYLDFSLLDTSNSQWVMYYWTIGACVTGLVMLLSMIYATVECCEQSFFSTENYDDAMEGFVYTRGYRSWTLWMRTVFRFISCYTSDSLESMPVNMGLINLRQKTLVWTKNNAPGKERARSVASRMSTQSVSPEATRHLSSPSIELTDYSTGPHDESTTSDTPAVAHYLFPPAITSRRPRNESEASCIESALPIFEQYGRSDESSRPLVQRPSDVHLSRASSSQHTHHHGKDRRGSGDAESDSRSSSEYAISPSLPHGEPSAFGEWPGMNPPAVHSRQDYGRASSDPGSPPDVVALTESEQDALGISFDPRDTRKARDKSCWDSSTISC